MRRPACRIPALLAVAAVTLLLASCGSNNKGKIVGKWKVVSYPGHEADITKMSAVGVMMGMEFQPDGGLQMLVVADKPDLKAMADKMTAELRKQNPGGKYTLGGGDTVTVSGMAMGGGAAADKGTSQIAISGDNMTIKDKDGTMQLTRVRE